MRLTATEFETEKKYQGLMFFLKTMMRDGMISENEYDGCCREYAQKLLPRTGSLLARYELLCVRNRVNMEVEEVGALENQKN